MSTTAPSTATSSGCARSSRRSTTSSRRSRPSMASAIATATDSRGSRRAMCGQRTRPRPGPAERARRRRWRPGRRCRAERVRWPRISPLTRRILAVNLLPLAILFGGPALSRRLPATSLIDAELDVAAHAGASLRRRARRGRRTALGPPATVLLPRHRARPIDAAGWSRRPAPGRGCSTADGSADRRQPRARRARRPGADRGPAAAERRRRAGRRLVHRRSTTRLIDLLPRAATCRSITSTPSRAPPTIPRWCARWPASRRRACAATADGGLMLSVAVPVQRYKQVLGALMLSAKRRRHRRRGARRAPRHPARSSPSRSASPCCSRSTSPAPSRGRSAAWPRPPTGCAAATARDVEIPDFTRPQRRDRRARPARCAT